MEQLRDGMVNRKTARSELKNAGYEIFIGILSVLSIVNIVLLYAIDDSNLDDVLYAINVTISTVGYGARYPVTNGGRLFGSLINIDVGIVGTSTGYLANRFLAPSMKSTATQGEPEAVDTRSKVRQLKALMAQQQTAMDEIDLLLQADGS